MRRDSSRAWRWRLALGAVGAALVVWVTPAPAQFRTGGGTGGGTSIGGGGTSIGGLGGGGLSTGGLGGISGGISGGGLGVGGGFSGTSVGFSGTGTGGLTGRTGGFGGSSGITSGVGFTGNGFSGGTGSTGGNFRPAATAAGVTGRGGTTSTGVSTTNPFVNYYNSPLLYGLPGGGVGGRFGTPLYGTTVVTGVTGGLGVSGGVGGLGVSGGVSGLTGGRTNALGGLTGGRTTGLGGAAGFGGLGTQGLGGTTGRRAPAFAATISFAPPTPTVSRLMTDARLVIDRSSALPSRANIQMGMDGEAIVLTGLVADDRERQMAEALLRLTPGVRDVRNELEIQQPSRPPK